MNDIDGELQKHSSISVEIMSPVKDNFATSFVATSYPTTYSSAVSKELVCDNGASHLLERFDALGTINRIEEVVEVQASEVV